MSVDMDHLYFDTGSSTLPADAAGQLDDVAAIMKAYPNAHLQIAGHTDNVGDNGANMNLSRARAEAVKDALVSRGIAANRMTTQGVGQENPIADNSSDAGRAKNRRVSMRVTER